ncbi:DEK C-terminal [Penicillium verhagenii]|uniref:DEK C-terminal n=1 Tax=Penicillium verhagenii TaxID=1562060 RepID=UPI00254530D4|nr:DEK C-terminal [Penicillium verhagenii]KAJ5924300.1 DEK C-terminal [Penicillium verhagenii]
MSLSSELRDRFTDIIDSILAKSDLNTISEKRIRKGLQEEVGYDLTPQKAAVKELIMARFDIYAEKNGVGESPEPANNSHQDGDSASAVPSPATATSSSPVKRQADSEEASDPSQSSPPPKKLKSEADVDADALFAAKLQAEENLRARPTRGGNTRRAAPTKKKSKSKAKTSKRVKAEDDSDVESGSDTKKEVNRTGGFHKPLNLSPPLAALLGEPTLSRPQTVKKVWQYIREKELQDPSDRRQIRCDDAMRAVFKQDRVHMFTMTKILNQNLYNPDE